MKQSSLAPIADRVRQGLPLPWYWSVVLNAATPAFRFGMWLRHRRTPVRVDAPVISFGNVTVGGTGKTPAVIARVLEEQARGRRVGVLTRGYGSRTHNRMDILVAGERRRDPSLWLGDEPELIARRAPGAIIVRCRDRVDGAQTAIAGYGCDTLILDDGFQYLRLERDENIVIIDATNPFGNGRLLPRGILREPIEALARATHIVLSRCDQADAPLALADRLQVRFPHAPLRMTRHAPQELWRVQDGKATALNSLQGATVYVACAIGNPEAFRRTIEEHGATIQQAFFFPDHKPIPLDALPRDDYVIVTEKDAVRMAQAPGNILALRIDLEDWLPTEEDRSPLTH